MKRSVEWFVIFFCCVQTPDAVIGDIVAKHLTPFVRPLCVDESICVFWLIRLCDVFNHGTGGLFPRTVHSNHDTEIFVLSGMLH